MNPLCSSSVRSIAGLCFLLAVNLAGGPFAFGDEGDPVVGTAALIDRHIFGQLTAAQIEPAPPASDSIYLRRVWLDIAGTIPPAVRARQFASDQRPGKRGQIVEELLERSSYVDHFAAFWRDILTPEVKSNQRVQQLLPGFDAWLRRHLANNTPYDKWVYELIDTPISAAGSAAQDMRSGEQRSAIAFFQAKEIAPENLAAATSRIFLGVRIECAQCHDHPFDNWTQSQFWSYAAFFAGIERQGNMGIFGRVAEVFDRRELAIPDTQTVVQAGYLDGSQPEWRRGVGSRKTLAEWITASNNPYFARMAVNRIWGKFFGVGLVDPVDDFTALNPPSHPELLAELAERFVESGFDLRLLIRSIVASRAYQLSSRQTIDGQSGGDLDVAARQRLLAEMPIKGLTPEQLFDSLATAVGSPARLPNNRGTSSSRAEFLELFANDTDPPTRQSTTILQALAMMNGELMGAAANLQQCPTLSEAFAASSDPGERVEALFFATLSRSPDANERARLAAYVEQGGSTRNSAHALEDVLWALLNSAEFATNH